MPKERSDAMEALTKAIEKAIAGGWKWHSTKHNRKFLRTGYYLDGVGIWFEELELADTEGVPAEMVMGIDTYKTIFNHDFARALWPEIKEEWYPMRKEWDKYGMWYYDGGYMPDFGGQEWQWHLQNMVVADDPIKYLEENM
jgi:hypothetical protein